MNLLLRFYTEQFRKSFYILKPHQVKWACFIPPVKRIYGAVNYIKAMHKPSLLHLVLMAW